MLRMTGIVVFVLAARAEPTCAPCHPRQTGQHANTNHARTLRRAGTTEFARAISDRPIGEARGGFLLMYRQEGDRLLVRAERGKTFAEGQIDWVLGAGDQGQTPLVSLAGRWLEHRISFYTKPGRFDLTLGHAPGASGTAVKALGIAQPEATVRKCVGCHGKVTAGTFGVAEAGVGCDRCHSGAAAHARGEGRAGNPAKLAARQQLELCAECHRLEAPTVATDPLNIRFQPLRLVKSACFLQGGATCLTCHTAHANAVRGDAGFYRDKCQGCHRSTHASEQRDCLACHMPKSAPAPYLEFTDHFIRRNK